jgi:hypothetical protein
MQRLVLVALFLFPGALLAQRPTPTFEHGKRAAVLAYGAVPVGKHSLAELPTGETWRLGNNEASTLRLELPLVAGDSVIAPGSYRVSMLRTDELAAALTTAGSGKALAATGEGRIDGKLGKAPKPTKSLDIQWRKKGAVVAGSQPAQIVVQFGIDEWVGDVTLVGNKPFAVPGWKAVLWQFPAARLETGLPTPVATFTRDDQSWNLVVAKDDVKLIPWMTAPTEQFGFGEVKDPAAALTTAGRQERLELKVEAPMATLELLSAKKQKGEIRLDVGFGGERVSWIVPEPKLAK